MVVVLAASAHRRVKKTKDVWRDGDAVDEDDDVMRLMMIQLRFRFRFFFGLV